MSYIIIIQIVTRKLSWMVIFVRIKHREMTYLDRCSLTLQRCGKIGKDVSTKTQENVKQKHSGIRWSKTKWEDFWSLEMSKPYSTPEIIFR